jgi:hypothetical protein
VPWDRERYRLEVLEPARRAGNRPPPDLFLRYGVTGDDTGFAGQVAAAAGYWRELKQKRTYSRLAAALLTAHAELERGGELTADAFRRRRDSARQEALQRLARLVQAESGAVTHVGPVGVARLRQAVGGTVGDAQVRKALADAGVRVVDRLPELPLTPPQKYADLTRHLQVLGLHLSAEVVFGDALQRGFHVLRGFRLATGERLDEAEIAGARRKVDELPYGDPRKTPTENVLAILRSAAGEPGRLDELLLWEVLGRLRPLATAGFVQKVIASQAHELGLDQEEAGILAAAMLAGDTAEIVHRQLEEELAAGRLRAAQQLAAQLPPGDELRERISERAGEVAAIAARAERELAEGRKEQAVRLFAEALAMADDDAELAERLGAIAPPPPRFAQAVVDDDRLLVTWQPSPTQAGRVRYRVVRGQHRPPSSPGEGTPVVTETSGHEAADPDAPVGVDLYYSVFATRGGPAWSRAVATSAIVFAPDVAGVSLDTEATSVSVGWRSHPGADGIVVDRAEGGAPRGEGAWTPVEGSASGFTDSGLRPGIEYHYRIRAAYRAPDGQRRLSPGVVVSAVPAPAPLPVTDLTVRLRPGSPRAIEASWTQPASGRVRLLLGIEVPGWRPGDRLSAEQLAAAGRVVPGSPRTGADGRAVMELDPPQGRHHLVAVTEMGRQTVAGTCVELVGPADPVTGLVAERRHDVVQLSWVWPAGATDVVIRWRPRNGEDGGERGCSRRVYDDEGGVSLTVGPDVTEIEVGALYPDPGGPLPAPSATVRVPERGVAVHYRFLSAGLLHRRRRIVELTTDRPYVLPPLVVVCGTGTFAPDGPDEGEEVARIPGRLIVPEAPLTVTVDLPARGPVWLACFVAPGADAPGLLLFPPPLKERKFR